MVQQYNVLQAKKAGEPWQNNYGKMMQTYFLDIENHSVTITCNRLTTSPAPDGPTWGEMEPKVSKTTNKTYMKFTVKAPPEDQSSTNTTIPIPGLPQTVSKPVQAPLDQFRHTEQISWGEAVIAAGSAVGSINGVKETAQVIVKLARELYNSSPVEIISNTPTTTSLVSDDVVIKDLADDEPVNLDEIPF